MSVLIIAANPAVSTTTGYPVGFWISEVAHPYKVLKEAGIEVVVASPSGGKLEMDAWSDPNHESGNAAWDDVSKALLADPEFTGLLDDTPSIDDLDQSDFDAIIVAGGQAPMFTFEDAENLQRFFLNYYASGKPTAALCHGVALLRYLKNTDGSPFVTGRNVTGFTNGEEDDADAAAGTQVMPWRIEDELSKLGANFQKGANWESFVVVDNNLITGQQNMSGEAVARAVLDLLEEG